MIGSNHNEQGGNPIKAKKKPLYALWATHQAQNYLLQICYSENVCRRSGNVNNPRQNRLLNERWAN